MMPWNHPTTIAVLRQKPKSSLQRYTDEANKFLVIPAGGIKVGLTTMTKKYVACYRNETWHAKPYCQGEVETGTEN